ncbi:LCP family protein required for cell wall assembly [Streptomyces achromogenes]|uniref:LCP family protein required for cell wall assembly n=1 Tax=Streptomyces achromogenes TaxID=67255 RepID=A0ABU0Q0S9_STRAH|nr:LCP family protein [Streptomyces achromogenes]MDQ0684243.1 LCP family protein required for cell wall assembly [Streptomyces achromogenes]MDQ0831338.1 LCP family protein required for cell wall assembly [Streptomyces achromogenes]
MTYSGGGGGPLGPGAGASADGRGLARRRRRRWVKYGAGAGAVVVLGVGVAGWAVYVKLDGNITPDDAAAAELARYAKERPTSLVKDAQNILVIGSDSRSGDGNEKYGRDSGTERSDTTILLHLAAGRRSATAVSLPRDLMVDVPGCLRRDGKRAEPTFAMFNYAFQSGGSACTIRTVEKLTGVRVDHHVVVDFSGFKDMVDAVDGVRVCLKEPISDKAAKLRLPAGKVTLDGEQALGYVRARKSLGDGSDTERMDRQQRFLGALVNKVQSNDVLLNPVKLYPLLDAATSSLTTDPDLASLRGLYELVRGLGHIPTENVQFLTVPRESYVHDANRDQLRRSEAEKLFDRLRTDTPISVSQKIPTNSPLPEAGDHVASRSAWTTGTAFGTVSPTPPAPTFRGNTAAEDDCG